MKIENARKISRMLLGLSLLIGGWWGYSAGQAENMKYAKRFGMTIEQFKHDEAYGG